MENFEERNDEEKKELEQQRHTEWLDPTEVSETQFGRISNLVWIKKEKERIEAKHGEGEIFIRKDGNITLMLFHENIPFTDLSLLQSNLEKEYRRLKQQWKRA